MGADDTLRVEPAVMQGFAASLDGAAEHLAVQLAELDAPVATSRSWSPRLSPWLPGCM